MAPAGKKPRSGRQLGQSESLRRRPTPEATLLSSSRCWPQVRREDPRKSLSSYSLAIVDLTIESKCWNKNRAFDTNASTTFRVLVAAMSRQCAFRPQTCHAVCLRLSTRRPCDDDG